jgi:hypothetical protein
MSRFRLLLTALVCVFTVASATTSFAQDMPASPKAETEKVKQIRKLIGMSAGLQTMKEQLDTTLARQKELLKDSGIPEAFWERFRARLQFEQIVEVLIPIYDKHFTLEDVNGLIVFYQTPLGKKLLEKNPLIYRESFQAGERYGVQVATEVMREIQEEERKKQNKTPETPSNKKP